MSKSKLLIGNTIVSTRIYGVVEIIRHYPLKIVPEFNTPILRIVFDNNIKEYSTVEDITKLIEENHVFQLIHPEDGRVVGNFDMYSRILSVRIFHIPKMYGNEYPIEIMMGVEKTDKNYIAYHINTSTD